MWAEVSPRTHRASLTMIFYSKCLKRRHMQKGWYYLMVRSKQIWVDPFHFSALCLSSPAARSFCPLAFTNDRPASSPGVTWHAVLVWFSASAGDANLFCLWLSFAAGCLSLFFEQIRLDGFHNCVSAAATLQNTEQLRSIRTSDISLTYAFALASAQRSMKKLN